MKHRIFPMVGELGCERVRVTEAGRAAVDARGPWVFEDTLSLDPNAARWSRS